MPTAYYTQTLIIMINQEKVLILRTSNKNHRSYGGFQWPKEIGSVVKCDDWEPTTRCGNGLHGALWGEGDGSLFNWSEDAVWQVVEANKSDVIDLDGKVKFPECTLGYVGNQESATKYIYEHGGQGRAIIGITLTAGYRGTATAGYRGTATAGDEGTATAGYRGTATAGYRGTATAGYRGTATAGDEGTATAGDEGTATAGDEGVIIIKYYCLESGRYKLMVGYIGEGGLEPNVAYKIDGNNQFVKG